MKWQPALLSLCLLACSDAEPPADAGGPAADAGVADAAPPRDAGLGRDAGAGRDGGAEDAGPECVDDEGCPQGSICLEGACFACGDGPDCDANGVPDRCDLARGPHVDCNQNAVPDRCDLAGPSLDCNQSGVPDECEVIEDACRTMSSDGDIEHRAGDLPIIISAPHGGQSRPAEIPDRDATEGADLRTVELLEATADALEARLGRRPHVVINHLYRRKLDANRDLPDAAQGDPRAERGWYAYHRYIDAAKRAVAHQHGRGLYVDLHGLAASRDAIEWGYLLNGTTLLQDDLRLDHPAFAHASSVRTLVDESPYGLSALIRGPVSLGGLLEGAGFVGVPAPMRPDPGRDPDGTAARFFSGGYNTRRHGSFLGGPVDGVQLETTWAGVRETAQTRAAFAAALADALERYVGERFGLSVQHPVRVEFETEEQLVLPGAQVELRVTRYGDRGAGFPVNLRPPADLTLPPLAFEDGAATAAVPFTAPERPGVYDIDLGRGAFNRGQRRTFRLVVLGPTSSGFTLEVPEDRLVEGERMVITQRRVRTEAAETVRLQVSTDRVHVEPEQLEFGPGVAELRATLIAVDDEVADGATRLRISSGAARQEITLVDDDLDPSLRAWWPGERVGLGHRFRWVPDPTFPTPTPILDVPGPGGRLGYRFPEGFESATVADDFDVASAAGFSLTMWFRTETADGAFRYLYSHGRLSSESSINLYLTASGRLRTALRGPGDEADYDALDVPGDLRDGVWRHYALSVSPGPLAEVFIDGVRTATAARGNLPFDPTTHAYLGYRYDLSETRRYTGELADLRIYDRALTPAEIAELAR